MFVRPPSIPSAAVSVVFVLIASLGCSERQPREIPAGGDGGGDGCASACEAGGRRCEGSGVEFCADYDGDGCVEWGGAVACPGGTACADGECVAACEHGCAAGEAVCSAGAVRRCAQGEDGCRALGDPEPCPDAERCDNGACVPAEAPCADGCDGDGDRACTDDGYQRCGEFDDDECLEWSVTIACDPGERCEAGECVPGCSDGCEAGEARCRDDGVVTCGNFDEDVCLELGAVTPCGDDERCDAGECVPAVAECEDACESDGDRACEPAAEGAPGGFRQCGQYDPDACLDLSPVVECGALERCEAGQCVAICEDECAAGAARCAAGGRQLCGNFNPEPCLEWGPVQACGEAQVCDDGACTDDVIPCEDACPDGAARCEAGGVATCGQHDEDDCLEWGAAAPCGAGQRCEGGGCVADCEDECEQGDVGCRAGGVSACGDHDEDPCLEMGPPAACEPGQSCVEGRCEAVCRDECAAGQARCTQGADGVERCGPAEADDCLHWSSPEPCGARQECRDGACEVVCQDECVPDERRCVGDGFEICGNWDADACLEFGGGAACGDGEACAEGACDSVCDDECPGAGVQDCADDLSWRVCGNFDVDACLEWAAPQACEDGEGCAGAGLCEPLPPPARVLVNEAFYNPTGDDWHRCFVELWGPAGTPLAGFSLVGINGANGQEYSVIPLAGAIGADGFYVIAHPDGDAALLAVADLLHRGANLQNGPDSVQLRWGDQVVDALGYGVFEPDRFFGEGDPAEDVLDASLSRDEAHTDTDDNATDFAESVPSPGLALPADCVPGCPGEGDLRCAADSVERCDLVDGCRAWVADRDCSVDGQRCDGGACVELVGCGNEVVEGDEECDDGNDVEDDGCSTQCARTDLGPPSDEFQRVFAVGVSFQPTAALSAGEHGGWYVSGDGRDEDGGDFGVVARLAANGAPLWARQVVAGGDTRISDLVRLPGGDLVAVGGMWTGPGAKWDALALRLAPDGALRWARAWGSPADELLRSVAWNTDAHLVAVGDTDALEADFRTDVLVSVITADGEPVIDRAIGSEVLGWDRGRDVLALGDGDLFVTGTSDSWRASIEDDGLFLRLSAQGVVEMAKTHSFWDLREMGRASLTANGEILYAGARRDFDGDDVGKFFARVRSDGESVFRATAFSSFSVFQAAVETAGGAMAVVGRDLQLVWERWAAEGQRTAHQRRATDGNGNWEAGAVVAAPDDGLFIAGRDNGGALWVLRTSAEDGTAGCHASDPIPRQTHFADPHVTVRAVRNSVLDLAHASVDAPLADLPLVEAAQCGVDP